MNDNANPYSAPETELETYDEENDPRDPVALPAGAGAAWFGSGWQLYKAHWGLWIGMILVFGVLYALVNLIPIIGGLAGSLLFPVFGAGFMLGCHAIAEGEELEFGHLFAGFRTNTGTLVAVGALYLVTVIVMALLGGLLIVGGAAGAGAFAGGDPTAMMQDGMPAGMLLGVLVMFALLIPVMMLFWFAPALVAISDIGAIEALKLSFLGCVRNILPFLVYGIVGFVLMLLASIPFGLGFLVLAPVMIASQYSAYRQIFLNRD